MTEPPGAPRRDHPMTILALQGRLDDSADAVVDTAVAAIAPTSAVVVFDLHDVDVVDGHGFRRLRRHVWRLRRDGRRVEFINVPAGAAPLLELREPDGTASPRG